MKTAEKKITMKMIGEMAGVSQQAVSLILNDKNTSRVGKATRDKVLQLVDQLGYSPDIRARSLASGKTNTLAVAGTATLAEFSKQFPARVFSGIGEVAAEHDYSLNFLPLRSGSKDRDLVSMVRGRVADGLIIIVYSQMEEHFGNETLPLLKKSGITFVAVTSTTTRFDCPQVAYDATAAGRLAAGHLAEQGAGSISFINYPSRSYHRQLLEGARAAVGNSVIKPVDIHESYYKDTADFGYAEGQKIIAGHGVDEAYLAFSDAFALGFIDALQEAGKRVPEDVLVMGCDDLYPPTLLRSRLTAIDRQPETAGRKAAEMFYSLQESEPANENPLITIQPELVVRTSTVRKK